MTFAPHLLGMRPPPLSMLSPRMPLWNGEPAFQLLRVDGEENVGQLFRYTLYATDLRSRDGVLCPSLLRDGDTGRTDADGLFGQALGVCIELEGGELARYAPPQQRWRCINGVVTGLRYLDADPQARAIELRLEPWFALARLRNHYRIFQDRTVLQVIDAVLREYPWPCDLQCRREYPRLDYLVQYGESDFDFVVRLMAQWGLGYHFQHDVIDPLAAAQAPAGNTGDAAQVPSHTLLITDVESPRVPQPCPSYREMHLQPRGDVHGEHDDPVFQTFESSLQLSCDGSQAWDYDFQLPRRRLSAQAGSLLDVAALPRPDFTQLHWPAGFDAAAHDAKVSEHLARVRQWYAERDNRVSHGQGRLRGLCPGYRFEMQGHASPAANGYHMVTRTKLQLRIAEARSADEPPQLQAHCEFECRCATRPMLVDAARDAGGTLHRPRVFGVQSAMVVAPPGNCIRTDPYGRVRVRFFWDQPGRPCDECSCWVRVARPASGGAQGYLAVPREGQEVVVAFEHGDPERPLILGQVTGPYNMPNWELPSQSALSGWRSRELCGGVGNHEFCPGNQLVFDDTQAQLQAQLGSDHAHSRLSLGRVTRIAERSGRQDARGEGFELRTDAFGALRAGAGMSLSTDLRAHGIGRIDERQESGARLRRAADQQRTHAQLAEHCKLPDAAAQAQLAQALRTAAHATTPQAGIENGAMPGSLAAPPDMNLGSAGSLHASAEHDVHVAAGRHLSLSSGDHASLSVAGSLLASATQGLRLFAGRAGLRLMAYAGDVEIRALRDNLRLWARLRLEESAEHISIRADKTLLLQGAGSALRLDDDGVCVQATRLQVRAEMDLQSPSPLGTGLRGSPEVGDYTRQLLWLTPAANAWGSLRHQWAASAQSQGGSAEGADDELPLADSTGSQALSKRLQTPAQQELNAAPHYERLATARQERAASSESTAQG